MKVLYVCAVVLLVAGVQGENEGTNFVSRRVDKLSREELAAKDAARAAAKEAAAAKAEAAKEAAAAKMAVMEAAKKRQAGREQEDKKASTGTNPFGDLMGEFMKGFGGKMPNITPDQMETAKNAFANLGGGDMNSLKDSNFAKKLQQMLSSGSLKDLIKPEALKKLGGDKMSNPGELMKMFQNVDGEEMKNMFNADALKKLGENPEELKDLFSHLDIGALAGMFGGEKKAAPVEQEKRKDERFNNYRKYSQYSDRARKYQYMDSDSDNEIIDDDRYEF